MTRRRFYASPDLFTHDRAHVTLDDAETRHLRSVLRLGTGDEAFVFDGEGREFRCQIEASERASVSLAVCEEVAPQRPESPLRLTLAVAMLKGEKFDFVVQKATELGVHRIVPVATKRADVRLAPDAVEKKRGGRSERWARLALEAAKQSGRAGVPVVEAVVSFKELVSDREESETTRLMFAERAGASLAAALGESVSESLRITALVGPEGGWDDGEIEDARAAGWRIVTLGGRTLRAETAAITVAALLQHVRGDLV